MNRSTIFAFAAAAACLAAASPASAEETRVFNIPVGALGDALTAFGVQSDRQILFTSDLVAGRRSNGLSGAFAPSVALDRLLAGTGLVWVETRPGVYVVRAATASAEEATEVGEVIVTGSLLRGSGPLSSPVLVLDRDALDRRGRGSVADVLADLPQNYAGSGTPGALLGFADPAGGNSALATGINLRGLGVGSTLTLVNGRRLAGTGSRGAFADASALPSAAVARVDVLLDGASALYGSDAVAGVVNIVMRRAFDGQESRLRVGAARGGGEDLTVSHLAGKSWDGGSAYVAYEHQAAKGLNMLDRSYTADGDLRPFGGHDRRGLFAYPGNIVAASGGAFAAQWAIRPGPSGTAQGAADFAAGQANGTALLSGADLTPDVRRDSLYGRVAQDLGGRFEASADVRFSRRVYGMQNAPTSTVFAVSAANPHFISPNGSAQHLIAYSFYGDLGPTRRKGVSRSLGVTAGGAYDLGAGWSLDGYLGLAEERAENLTFKVVNSAFLAEALGNGPDNPATAYDRLRDGYFNPFGAGAANNRAVLDFISQGYSHSLLRNRAGSANLLARGPLMRLPGGDLDLAVGYQARRESLASRARTLTSTAAPRENREPDHDREVQAGFVEARLPIVGSANARRGLERLEVTAAVRIEDYDDFGSTTNPRIGAVWSPAQGWNLRASWGTSFKAPALTQMFDASAATMTTVPRSDGLRVTSIYLYGGNPDLKPETAETWTAGFDYRAEGGGRLSLGYFDIRFSDRINQPINENLQAALTNPDLAPFVRLVDPAGNPADMALVRSYVEAPGFPAAGLYPPDAYGAILDGRWVNAAAVEVRGLDFAGSWPVRLGAGELTFDVSASYLFDYDQQNTPAAPLRSVRGLVGYPSKLRSRAGATWTRGEVFAGMSWSHVAAYEDREGTRIDAWNTADLQLGWDRGDGLRALFNVQNLFDADPPFYDSTSGVGFDPGGADPLGRVVSLQLIKRW
ncbi:TonB-dependent receptor domain-containing protein [Brevundimonas sp. NPDC090276]|uniref:TonB-dependent receptor domain-containing protein n=1 Tax=Brevundimonas sp. NPDC090276 TaxID=3363956 RepID=UPI003839D27B